MTGDIVKKHLNGSRPKRKPLPRGAYYLSVVIVSKPIPDLTEDFRERNIQLWSRAVIHLREDGRRPEAQETQARGQDATYD
jgi:hypothetical protein